MHEAIIGIKKLIEAIEEIINSIELGVMNGHQCPTCAGSVKVVGDETMHYEGTDYVMVPLVKPESCGECFFEPVCIVLKKNKEAKLCLMMWEKIIDAYKK